MSLEEFKIGQLYMIAKISQEDDSISDVEILKNEPFENSLGSGIYTHKKFHLERTLPDWLQSFFPKNILVVEEKSWNIYPLCTKTIYHAKALLASFNIEIVTKHENGNGEIYNIHQLSDEMLNQRVITHVDIGEDLSRREWHDTIPQPSSFTSMKTKRGPLKSGLMMTTTPLICAYKLVKIKLQLAWCHVTDKSQ